MYRVLSAFFSCVVLICTAQSSSDFTCGSVFGLLRPSLDKSTNEEVKRTLDSCMDVLAQQEAGRCLLAKMRTLWAVYKHYEPNVLLGLEDGEPRFQGMDTKSPVINKTSGFGGLEIIWEDETVNWEEMQGGEDPRAFFNRQKGEAVIEETQQCWYKDPSVVFYCPKNKKALDTIGDQPAATLLTDNKWVVCENVPVKLFIAVAHELIHMKHFLEERLFISQIVSGLIKKVDTNKKLYQNILEFCEKLESLPDDHETLRNIIIGAVKELPKLRQLCTLASQYGIESNFQVVTELTTVDSLASLPYSCCGLEVTIAPSILEQFPEFKEETLANHERKKLRDLITDFEERRTVIGPDRDGITEARVRFEFKEPIRFIYQTNPLSVPIQCFKDALQFDETTFAEVLQRLDRAPS